MSTEGDGIDGAAISGSTPRHRPDGSAAVPELAQVAAGQGVAEQRAAEADRDGSGAVAIRRSPSDRPRRRVRRAARGRAVQVLQVAGADRLGRKDLDRGRAGPPPAEQLGRRQTAGKTGIWRATAALETARSMVGVTRYCAPESMAFPARLGAQDRPDADIGDGAVPVDEFRQPVEQAGRRQGQFQAEDPFLDEHVAHRQQVVDGLRRGGRR